MGERCISIYRISLQKDKTFRKFPYKITGIDIDDKIAMENLGFLRQDLKSKKIIWRRIKLDKSYEDIELQDIKQQQEFILNNLKSIETIKLIQISQIIKQKIIFKKIDIDKYFNFIVRIFGYDTEPKLTADGKVRHTIGGFGYELIAIQFGENIIYKSDNYQLYKERIEKKNN